MAVSVERLMAEIEDDVRQRRRKRLLARGAAAEYRDAELYAGVDEALRRAVDLRNHEALLLPDLLTGEADWDLSLHLRYASHRKLVGGLLIAIKRRVLLPMTRWLYEYSLENFRKQRRMNRTLFACIEELAIENARLRLAVERAGIEIHPRDGHGGTGSVPGWPDREAGLDS